MFDGFTCGHCATYPTNPFWPDRMKDCNTVPGGERINSKVIRTGCYSFTVLSHPDSSMISGKDLSCPNKFISQVSWLGWTSRRSRAEDRVLGGCWYSAAYLVSHRRRRGCSNGEGMSLFRRWEKWSCSDSDTTPAWKTSLNWNNLVRSFKKTNPLHNLQLQFSEYFWQWLT